jgi:putative hemolysin
VCKGRTCVTRSCDDREGNIVQATLVKKVVDSCAVHDPQPAYEEMIMKQRPLVQHLVFALVLSTVLLAACTAAPTPAPAATPGVGLPNPASVFCQEKGGQLKIARDAAGNESGLCLFPDGSQCEEWAFFRGECQPGQTPAATPKDATYQIEGNPVTLVNGLSEVEAAPGSASKTVTRYFGNEATGDLDGDGQPDVAFLLTQESGGSGTFFYVVAALQTEGGYVGTNAILLGDRIAPQSTTIQDGTIVVNYAERKPGEPFTAAPSVGVSKYFKVVDGNLVAATPEGAAAP